MVLKNRKLPAERIDIRLSAVRKGTWVQYVKRFLLIGFLFVGCRCSWRMRSVIHLVCRGVNSLEDLLVR